MSSKSKYLKRLVPNFRLYERPSKMHEFMIHSTFSLVYSLLPKMVVVIELGVK